jgi:hypothetical protein
MTRRERNIRILDSFGGLAGFRLAELDAFIDRHGFALFTDDAIAKLTEETVANWRRTFTRNPVKPRAPRPA